MAAATVLWLTFELAPDWVRQLDETSWAERLDEGWLSQLFDGLGRWWADLSGWERLLAVGAVVVLSGGTFALAGAGVGGAALGGVAWGSGAFSIVDNTEHIATFTRDPVGGMRRYWSSATPGSLLLDGATLALTAWAPSRLAIPIRGKIDDLVRRDAPPEHRGAREAPTAAPTDPGIALGELMADGPVRASDLEAFGVAHGWVRSQTPTGPIKYSDENGVVRLTIKSGSPRAPGSIHPHVEIRNAAGLRTDASGNIVTRKSAGNHTPIEWDY